MATRHDVGVDQAVSPFASSVTRTPSPLRSAPRALIPSRKVSPCFSSDFGAEPPCPVHPREDAIEELDDGHLGAEPAPHRAELEPDGAGPITSSRRGTRRKASASVELTMRSAVEREVAKRHRLAAGREQHPLALDHLLATLAPDAHPVRASSWAVR